ncbi:hypothetical protein ACA910_011523 [Epithemia clementina (nom. ined.)]
MIQRQCSTDGLLWVHYRCRTEENGQPPPGKQSHNNESTTIDGVDDIGKDSCLNCGFPFASSSLSSGPAAACMVLDASANDDYDFAVQRSGDTPLPVIGPSHVGGTRLLQEGSSMSVSAILVGATSLFTAPCSKEEIISTSSRCTTIPTTTTIIDKHVDDRKERDGEKNESFIEHLVMESDTLPGLCLRYHISKRQLQRANGFDGDSLRLAPKRLLVPITEKAKRLGWKPQNRNSKPYKMAAIVARCKHLSMDNAKRYLENNSWNLEEALQQVWDDEVRTREEEDRLCHLKAIARRKRVELQLEQQQYWAFHTAYTTGADGTQPGKSVYDEDDDALAGKRTDDNDKACLPAFVLFTLRGIAIPRQPQVPLLSPLQRTTRGLVVLEMSHSVSILSHQ